MTVMDSRESSIINAIHRNHQHQLENHMITHFGVYFELSEQPEKIYSWIEKIEDTRLLTNQYLESIVLNKVPSTKASLENETFGFSFYINKAKLMIPESIRTFFFDLTQDTNDFSLFNSITADIFSVALGSSITGVLFDYFKNQFSDNQQDPKKRFTEILDKQTELSHLIKQECERIAAEVIKLFHFREMLLFGKMSRTATEPDVREEFIHRAKIRNQPQEMINIAIEVYFARELSKIFNNGFMSLYQVHDVEIQSELQSPFIKWINQLSESDSVRMAFTQEIQLKFMLLAKDFLLEKKNQLGFFAKHPIVFSSIAGLIVALTLVITISLTLGTAILWGIGAITLVAFALASMGTYYLLNKLDVITYKRSPDNREQIQQSINMINNEFLRLRKEFLEKKDSSTEVIENTRNFEHINQNFLQVIDKKRVARGSISGWLREYASRYRHSKAIEVDLGDEYKKLIFQSRNQTKELVVSINKREKHILKQWINGTQNYLRKPHHQEVIKEFELIPKFKEQVLEIVSQLNYFPPSLLAFYCAPIDQGGLDGNESDFAQIKRLTPLTENDAKGKNPYTILCDTALNLFKKHEPLYTSKHIFLGDPEYRNMLGMSRGDYGEPVTEENIDTYLYNSYAYLLSLCNKIAPGLGLDPLIQPAQVSNEFILYRMLLLKQLASLASVENKKVNSEVKLKIKAFIQKHFNQDTKILFDNLANQIFLLNKEVQTSQTYKNNDDFVVTDLELDNIYDAIILDVVYNSFSFKLIDVLNYYINDFLHHKGPQTPELFAANATEQELNPQGTQQFIKTIAQYCENTTAFLQKGLTNKALTSTNILECYRYNVSLQVYKTQLRIVKNLKEFNNQKVSAETKKQMDYLINAFKQLSEFAKIYCYGLKESSQCLKLFNHINRKVAQPSTSNDWLKLIDSAEALILLIDKLPENIKINVGTVSSSAQFFSAKRLVKDNEELLPEPQFGV